MKFILLSLAVAMFIIGLYETMVTGISAGYFFFMLSIGLVIWTRLRVIKEEDTKSK